MLPNEEQSSSLHCSDTSVTGRPGHSYNPIWLQTTLSRIGGDDRACLKAAQAIRQGVLLTGMLVSSSCGTVLGALCLQTAPRWSCSPGRNSLLCTQRCQRSPGHRNAELTRGNISQQCHTTASLPRMSLGQWLSAVTPQIGSLRGRKMQ